MRILSSWRFGVADDRTRTVIHRARSVTVTLAGAVLAAVAHALMYLLTVPFYELLLFAALAGTGYGLVFAATITSASTAQNPDRIYALGNGATSRLWLP